MCEKCETIKQLVLDWVNKKGHDQCHYYPDIFRAIAQELGIDCHVGKELPPREEFSRFCERFQEEIFLDGQLENLKS